MNYTFMLFLHVLDHLMVGDKIIWESQQNVTKKKNREKTLFISIEREEAILQ